MPVGLKRAEARARYYAREEARRLGWDVRHPAQSGSFIEEQELVDYFPALKDALGAERPDFAVLGSNRHLRMVIECKNDFNKIDLAIAEAKEYSDKINKIRGFDVRVAVGVAGTPDKRIQTRCFYLKDKRWVALKSHQFELTQLPTLQELETALENDNGTTDVQLPDEREFFDAAIKISNILRLAKIVEADRPKVIGAIIVALYHSDIPSHPEVVIDEINAKVKAAVYNFDDIDHTSRDFLVQTLHLSTESRSLVPSIPNVVQQLERLNVRSIMRSGVDFLGQFYEAFLRYGSDAKSLGIVFTPRHITRYCAELADVRLGMTVYDPACGTGGFLVAAFDRMWREAITPSARAKVKKSLFGSDTNATVWALAVLNMFFRGDGKSRITFKSCFDNPQPDDHSFSRVLMNPPFAQEGEPESQFIDHALAKLEPGGQLAVVVKSAVAAASNFRKWRRNLVEEHHVLGVISLPTDLFYPTGAPTVIMIIKAHAPDRDRGTFLARIENDGYTISKNRRVPVAGSQLGQVRDLFRDYLKRGTIDTVRGVACVIARERIADGQEICAERWLPSGDFTIEEFEGHRVELVRQMSMALAKRPEIADELIEEYDELLASAGPTRGRPTTRTSLAKWFEMTDAKTHEAKEYPPGSIPYVSSSEEYNSIVNMLQPPDDEVYDTPVLSVTGFGTAYIQPWRFFARGHAGSAVRILKPIVGMTVAELAWFAAQINWQKWRIHYSRMATPPRLSLYEVEPPPAGLPVMSGLKGSLLSFRDRVQEFFEAKTGSAPLSEVFQTLASAWRSGRGRTSSVDRMAEHPAYRQIVELGHPVVPHILQELARKPDHWFVALHELTGEDPVPEKDRGKLTKMAAAWVQWGKERGLID